MPYGYVSATRWHALNMQPGRSITVTEDWSKNWQAKIAVRITSIVLWSLTLLSMIIAALLISQVKKETEVNQAMQMDQLAYLVTKTLGDNPQTAKQVYASIVAETIAKGDIESVEINLNGEILEYGEITGHSEKLIRQLSLPIPITITAHVKPLEQSVRDKQIEILMIFSLSLVTLGAFLGLIIDKYVRRPFQHLDAATQEYIAGNKKARVDITSQDEFGVLASFMNEMLDRIDENEERLTTEVRERKLTTQQIFEQRDALQQLTHELTDARDAANKANYAKSAFLANMSHELRTPLNAVIGYSELLIEEMGDMGNHVIIEDLQKIRQAGKHLLTLINDVLDISKIEAGKMELMLEEFSIGPMIEDVANMIRPLMAKNNNKFSIIMSEDMGNMYADITRVKQVLFNLLGNASKFTKQGKINLQVEKSGADFIDFKIIDTGIGIELEKIDRLFQDFVQVDDSATRVYGGTGLGLSICRRLSHLMGGDVLVRSKLREGSTFIAHLPRKVKISQAVDIT